MKNKFKKVVFPMLRTSLSNCREMKQPRCSWKVLKRVILLACCSDFKKRFVANEFLASA